MPLLLNMVVLLLVPTVVVAVERDMEEDMVVVVTAAEEEVVTEILPVANLLGGKPSNTQPHISLPYCIHSASSNWGFAKRE